MGASTCALLVPVDQLDSSYSYSVWEHVYPCTSVSFHYVCSFFLFVKVIIIRAAVHTNTVHEGMFSEMFFAFSVGSHTSHVLKSMLCVLFFGNLHGNIPVSLTFYTNKAYQSMVLYLKGNTLL